MKRAPFGRQINIEARYRHLSAERRRRFEREFRAVAVIESRRDKVIEIAAAVLSLAGAGLNALEHVEGFYVWLVANALWCWFGWRLRRWGMVIMFGVYFVTSVMGIVVWGRT